MFIVCVIVSERERERETYGLLIKSKIASKNTHELVLFEEREIGHVVI